MAVVSVYRADCLEDNLADHRCVVVEDVRHILMRPCLADALAVIDGEVEAGIAGADLARQIDLGCNALADDVGMTAHHRDFRGALEVAPVRHGVGAACEDTPREALLRRLDQGLAHLGAERIAHDEQVAPVEHDVLADREVEVIVGDDEVAQIEELVDRADAALRDDALDARFAEDPEDLPRGIGARHARAPAVHAHGQHALLTDAEEAHRGAPAVRRLEIQSVLKDLHIFIGQVRREIARERARAADDGVICTRDLCVHCLLFICHDYASLSL